jgi:CHAT domain-containing protein
VESQSAKEITVGLFENLGDDPALSKGEALARTQRAMITGRYGAVYRHPYFWAAYFLTGDASR